MEHVLNWLAERRFQFVGGNLVDDRVGATLHPDMRVVIITRNRALRTDDDKTAFGLRLGDPGIGEGAPAGFELRQAVGVAANGDGVLVDLQPLRLIDDRGYLDWRLALHEPGPDRCTVAEIVEQAAAAGGLAVPPRGRLLAPHILIRPDPPVGAMI